MKVYKKTHEVTADEIRRPHFYKITDEVKQAVAESGVQEGICVVYSHHTTCSVYLQECSFDYTYNGHEYLQQDMLDVLERLVPTCRKEGQYMHPGPGVTEVANSIGEDKPLCLNTDAHLRSPLLGRSETMVVEDGQLDLGRFGHVYFIDFDQTRSRTRQIKIKVLGV